MTQPTDPPLSGIRVVDFTWIVAGPTCTRLLGDFGAEVIRVENQQTLDSIRFGRPHPNGFDPPDSSAMFNWLNRNKRSITLNARHPQGLELLKRLIAVSDVVVENYSSRVLESWGLGYEEQRAIREDIIYVSLCGFGHSGPQREYGTWGPTAQALSGLTAMSGFAGQEPAGWGYSYLDHMAGFTAAAAIAAAVVHRRRTGEGQYIDLSQVESGMVLTGPATLDFTVNGRRYRDTGNPPGNRAVWPRGRAAQHLSDRRRRQLDHDHLPDRRALGRAVRADQSPPLARRRALRHAARAAAQSGRTRRPDRRLDQRAGGPRADVPAAGGRHPRRRGAERRRPGRSRPAAASSRVDRAAHPPGGRRPHH